MKVVGRSLLDAFVKRHADAWQWISNWIADVELSTWTTSHDIKARYASASFLHKNVVIFNVNGNKYRLETIVAYKTAVVSVSWVGTHAEYDQRNRDR
jgi:mRNA interferase HigB